MRILTTRDGLAAIRAAERHLADHAPPDVGQDPVMERPAPDPFTPYLTITEACRLLRCGRTRAFELIRSGELRRADKAPGRGTHVSRASVEAYLARVAPPPRPPRTTKRKPAPGLTTPAEMQRELAAQRAALLGSRRS